MLTRSGIIFLCVAPIDLPDHFFKLCTRAHDLATAAQTAELKVRADAQHLPALFTAGVLLFHRQNVTDSNVHRSLSLDALPVGARGLLGLVVAVLVIVVSLELIGQLCGYL